MLRERGVASCVCVCVCVHSPVAVPLLPLNLLQPLLSLQASPVALSCQRLLVLPVGGGQQTPQRSPDEGGREGGRGGGRKIGTA